MLDKTFTPPKYAVDHLEATPIYSFRPPIKPIDICVPEEEKQEILSRFNSLSLCNRVEVLYQLFHCNWDSRLLGEYQGYELALKVLNVLLPLAYPYYLDNCSNDGSKTTDT